MGIRGLSLPVGIALGSVLVAGLVAGCTAPLPIADLGEVADLAVADEGIRIDSGDDLRDMSRPADFAVTDLSSPDLAPGPDLAVRSIGIGKACPVGDECGMGQICLNDLVDDTLPPGGYCTRPCADDMECGDDAFCGPAVPGLGSICWKLCGPNDACGAGQVCSRRLNGFIDLVRKTCLPGDSTAIDGSRCKGFYQCNKGQACNNNPFETPGGTCITLFCTPGDDATCAAGGDAICLPLGPAAACVDRCQVDADCRIVEGFECLAVPNDPNMNKVCVLVHRRPGAACMSDAQCGPGTTPWRCLTGAAFPSGYCAGSVGTCTGSSRTCPDGATCYDPTPMQAGNADQYCAAECAADADCRMNDGYRCLPLEAGNPNGQKGCRLP